MSYINRDLFGGAITVETADLVDASDLRQVPDNQEVFMYHDSSTSIIVEILQRVDCADDNEAIKFHFKSLASDNDAQSYEVDSISVVPNARGDQTPRAVVLHGTQGVPKFNRPTPDKVEVLMALYRISAKNVDLVVTFNIPLQTADGGAVSEVQREKVTVDFERFVKTLCIKDFGLFA